MHTSQGGPGRRAHVTKSVALNFRHDFSPLTQVYAAGTVLGGWLAALASSHELFTCTRQGHLSHKQRSPQKDSITDVMSHKMRLLQMLPCILYAPSAISSSTSNTATVRLTTQPAIPSYYDFSLCFAFFFVVRVADDAGCALGRPCRASDFGAVAHSGASTCLPVRNEK